MNMNHHTLPPRPGPECESFASLLALAGQKRLDPGDSSALRAHLATCDYCQRERAAYQRLDSALQRHFGSPARAPLSPDDITQMMSEAEPMHTRRSGPPVGATMLHDDRPRRRVPVQPPPQRHQRPQRRRGIIISAISAAAAVLVIALIGAALFASGAQILTGHPRTPAPTSNPTPKLPAYFPGNSDDFTDIAMVSPNEGWIIGENSSQSSPWPLLLHYVNGQVFQVDYLTLQGPQANTTRLTQIGMLSHTEGWAIGTYQPNAECTNTLFLRYTGGRWTQVDTISGAALTSVALTSPTNGWAVGTHASTCSLGPTSPVLLYHYDGTTWTPAAVPPETSALGKVVMISATDGWAIGTRQSIGSNGSYSLLLHYDGKTWTEVSVPGINESAVGIAMASATDGWLATSILPDPTAATPTHLHLYQYDGKQWSKVSTPLDTLPPTFPGATLSLAPSGDGWLITSEEQSNIIREPLYLQLTGDTWSHVDGPAGIFGRIFPLSANDAWAVGLAGNESGDGSSLVAAIMHYHNGTWERVPLTSSSTP